MVQLYCKPAQKATDNLFNSYSRKSSLQWRISSIFYKCIWAICERDYINTTTMKNFKESVNKLNTKKVLTRQQLKGITGEQLKRAANEQGSLQDQCMT